MLHTSNLQYVEFRKFFMVFVWHCSLAPWIKAKRATKICSRWCFCSSNFFETLLSYFSKWSIHSFFLHFSCSSDRRHLYWGFSLDRLRILFSWHRHPSRIHSANKATFKFYTFTEIWPYKFKSNHNSAL